MHCGYYMQELDCLSKELSDAPVVTEELIDAWDLLKPYLSNRSKIVRHNAIRAFAKFAYTQDGISYVPDTSKLKNSSTFTPHIFTVEEIRRLLYAADNLPVRNNAPTRHLVIDAANRMTAIEFLRRYRPNSLVKSSARGEYQLAQHDSFKINGESSVWHWKSRDIGGKSALKYLIYVEGVPFVEAVQLLCEESPTYIPVQHEAVERERPPFRLPNPALNNDRVTRYLLGRGISLPTIRYCIERKILYESAEYHNCVFLGKDPQGVPKYAALRGIYDYGKPFKREAPGSQKQYGFYIPPMQPGTTVAVFEAAIDAMAEMTLCGDAADKYRLSLGGVSSSGKEPLALQEFLRQHPEITTIELRLDNDAKGRMASVNIQNLYREKYQVCDLPPNIENGDYADMAKNNLMARTAAHRAAPCR